MLIVSVFLVYILKGTIYVLGICIRANKTTVMKNIMPAVY